MPSSIDKLNAMSSLLPLFRIPSATATVPSVPPRGKERENARSHKMKKKRVFSVLHYLPLTVFLTFCSLGSSVRAQQTADRPNIVIILADDLGYGDVSFNGCPDYLTPNIDALASTGVRCSNGYVTHPFCSPSRAALLTGRYQQRFGHENQPDDNAPSSGLPLGELLLPQILKPAG